MEKRAIGVVLTLLGVVALVCGAYYFVNGGGARNARVIITCAILGLVFFLSGISLVRGTRDVIRRDEHIS